MNKVFLNGYLATDPKQRITSKGFEQSSFSIGVTDLRNFNESYFFPCIAWNNQAKFINSNLKKGSFVAIDGRLTRRSYVNEEGKNVYITEVIVDNLKTYGNSNRSTTSSTQALDQTSTPVKNNNTSETITIIDEVINNSINQVEAQVTNDEETPNDEKAFDWDWDLD